jgi:hypothetical protein
MSPKPPYGYRAFSLNIVSDFPVIGFEPAPVNVPDVTIREGEVPENLERRINNGVLYQSNDMEFLLRVDNVAAYYVRNGDEITIKRLGIATIGEVAAFLVGTSFGALLHQRRLLPLHACTVIFNNKSLLFAGKSGVGKSTMAAVLVQQGGTLVADDISVIDFSGEYPAVYPAFPYLKIWEDSLLHLGLSTTKLEPVRGELKKYYLPVHSFASSSVNLDHIFILGSQNQPKFEIKSIRGFDKFHMLKKHTFLFRSLHKTGLERNHFLLVNKLADKVAISLLIRPRGSLDTNNLVDLISVYLNNP